MREFVVTLRCGLKFVVKADRVVRLDHQYLALILDRPPAIGDADGPGDIVAMFERNQAAVVVARNNLVSEEKCDPIGPGELDGAGNSDIPF
jgi:hypothetical protein